MGDQTCRPSAASKPASTNWLANHGGMYLGRNGVASIKKDTLVSKRELAGLDIHFAEGELTTGRVLRDRLDSHDGTICRSAISRHRNAVETFDNARFNTVWPRG